MRVSVDPPPVALLVLRCWTEDGLEDGFRAHVTVVQDVTEDAAAPLYLSSRRAVLDIVRSLLDTVVPEPSPLPADAGP